MLCAIHQPNFFPWMGYFNKIYRADVFVFMDDVAYEKSGHSMQSYTNRVSILNNGKAEWIRCPVIREHGDQIIKAVLINENIEWKSELKRKIITSYKNTDFFSEVYPIVEELINNDSIHISDLNIYIIKALINKLHIDTPTYIMSDMETHYSSTKLLIEIINSVGCDEYLCGGGAVNYQEDKLFDDNGIKLIYQNYKEPFHVQYGISEEFIGGQSILDTMFNCGFAGTEKMVKQIEA